MACPAVAESTAGVPVFIADPDRLGTPADMRASPEPNEMFVADG